MTSLVPPAPAPIPGSFASSSAATQVPSVFMSGPSLPPVRPPSSGGRRLASRVPQDKISDSNPTFISEQASLEETDHGDTPGANPAMTIKNCMRKTKEHSKDFPAEWIELLDSFYGHHPSISPPYIAKSLEDLNVTVDPLEQPLPDSEAKSQRSVKNGAGASTIRYNSGVKRKNASGKAATLLSNSVTTFTTSMLELEKKRDEREENRIAAIHEIEKRKERLERSRQMDHEIRQALTTAIASLALAIGKVVERQQM
ncbi:hypothetical protein R1flu_004247 [Riccia fluitans]|uniref:Uncharacterized protein n=1 Tax=Riccia fluitans TaxID=41844 RepID=A0ABD1YQB7_9MARC